MNKRKYLILPLIIILILSFSLPSFASDNYEFTFKEIMTAGGLTSTLTGYNGSIDVTPTWNWANFMVINASGSTSHYRVEAYSNNNTLFNIYTDNNVLLMKCPRFTAAANQFNIAVLEEYTLRFGFRFLLEDGTFKYVYSSEYHPSGGGENEASFKRPYVWFDGIDLDIPVPSGSTRLYSIILDFIFPANDSSILLGTWGGPLTFFVGPKSEAPIYEAPSIPGQDSYDDSESELMDKSTAGLDDAKSLMGSFGNLMESSSAIVTGGRFIALSVNAFLTKIPSISTILTYSLTLGVLIFVIGAVGVFVRRR